jgi:hypothetical protein
MIEKQKFFSWLRPVALAPRLSKKFGASRIILKFLIPLRGTEKKNESKILSDSCFWKMQSRLSVRLMGRRLWNFQKWCKSKVGSLRFPILNYTCCRNWTLTGSGLVSKQVPTRSQTYVGIKMWHLSRWVVLPIWVPGLQIGSYGGVHLGGPGGSLWEV